MIPFSIMNRGDIVLQTKATSALSNVYESAETKRLLIHIRGCIICRGRLRYCYSRVSRDVDSASDWPKTWRAPAGIPRLSDRVDAVAASRAVGFNHAEPTPITPCQRVVSTVAIQIRGIAVEPTRVALQEPANIR